LLTISGWLLVELISDVLVVKTDAHVTTVIPLVFKYCQQAFSKQDETLSAISRHFGKLCQGLAGRHIALVYQSYMQ